MSIEFIDPEITPPPVGVDLFTQRNNGYAVCQFLGGDVLDSLNYKWPGNLYIGVPDGYVVI